MSIGVRLEREPPMFPAGTVFRPLRDQIIVRALEWEPSKLIVIAGNQRKPMRGVVVFVGPGERVKRRWKDRNGQVNKIGETGQVIPTEVKPGDVVELGGLEIDGYAFQQILIGHVPHVICQEKDVAGVVGKEAPCSAYMGNYLQPADCHHCGQPYNHHWIAGVIGMRATQ